MKKYTPALLLVLLSPFFCSAEGKPNILILFADDIGYEKLGCYGGLNVETPELDKMAGQGVRFTRAYTSAVCTPSRMSFYTGMCVPHHGYTRVLPVHLGSKDAVDFIKMPCYAQTLRDNGYLTSVTGKWQLAGLEAHPNHVMEAGFDSWCIWQIWREGSKTTRYWNPTLNHDGKIREDIADRYGPDVLTEYVIGQMRKAKEKDQPFLIHHNMMLPHVPIHQTPDDVAGNEPANLNRMIRYMDKQVGIILDALNELELTRNTLVFFMGDNGTESSQPRLTSHGIVSGGKHQLNEGGTHVPLIAWSPGNIPAGRVVNDLVDSTDFFPTLCELAGATIPVSARLDGVSFASPLLGKGAGRRSYVSAGLGDDFFVFDGEWRLHKLGNRLIDCRELPMERAADMSSEIARRSLDRLQPILDGLLETVD